MTYRASLIEEYVAPPNRAAKARPRSQSKTYPSSLPDSAQLIKRIGEFTR
jgi:hypothetical protein